PARGRRPGSTVRAVQGARRAADPLRQSAVAGSRCRHLPQQRHAGAPGTGPALPPGADRRRSGLAGGAPARGGSIMSWTLAPARDFAQHRDAWSRLHASLGPGHASSLLAADFVAPLIGEFGRGDELLACFDSGTTVLAMA